LERKIVVVIQACFKHPEYDRESAYRHILDNYPTAVFVRQPRGYKNEEVNALIPMATEKSNVHIEKEIFEALGCDYGNISIYVQEEEVEIEHHRLGKPTLAIREKNS